MRILRNDESDTGDVTSPQCEATSPEIDDYMDWMDDIISPNDTPAQEIGSAERVHREMLLYISETATKGNQLMWWSRMEPIFPRLAQLTRKYLCIPASNVAAERIFSTVGHLVNLKRRAALSPDNVNMLIFLNKNIGNL